MVCDSVGRRFLVAQQTLSLRLGQYGKAKPFILRQQNQWFGILWARKFLKAQQTLSLGLG